MGLGEVLVIDKGYTNNGVNDVVMLGTTTLISRKGHTNYSINDSITLGTIVI